LQRLSSNAGEDQEKICVIMQPTYLPWLGYFDLIDQSDVFIFLDNVQFEKQSWQQRNRIKTKKGLEWLTIPSITKGRLHQLINEVEIASSKMFPRNHLRTIEMIYKQAVYFEHNFVELYKIMTAGLNLLCDLNISIIKWLSSVIGIPANFIHSSDLKPEGKRSSLLVDLCKKTGANNYLSTPGAKEYLIADYQKFSDAGIEVWLHNYEHPEYRQLYFPFMPYASVIDLLFNEGERSLEIIRSGRRKSLRLIE